MANTFTQFTDFADTLEQCHEIEEVWSATERFGRKQGLPRIACAYAGVGRVGTLDTPQIRSTCTGSRIESWATSKLYMRDPCVKRAQASPLSFCWGLDYLTRQNNDPKIRSFYRELTATVRSMFVVPLPRVRRGALGMGILGNTMPKAEFEPFIEQQKSLLMLAMIYADRRLMELHGQQRRSEIALLPREAECLEWMANGAGVDGAAERMGLKASVVMSHLAAARTKLHAATLEQAIAIALKQGLIRP